jgi:uridine kinase
MTLYAQNARDAILDAPSVHGMRIVGIDGPSGAGKSTFALQLASLLDAPIIHIDDFVSWNDFAGWWPRFENQVLDPLLRGEPTRYQQRDWVSDEFGDSLGQWATVAWSPVILVEGVTCTRRDSIGKLAYAVWMEAPEEERLRRGIERDGESHRSLWRQWMEEESQFFAADHTRDRANLIVPGI